MSEVQILESAHDASANFVYEQENISGVFESRYVERAKQRPDAPEYFAVYLSVQSGCNQGCNFCHLTTTGQTKFVNAGRKEILRQADTVLNWYYGKVCVDERAKADVVHFNFMARGEFFANREALGGSQQIFWELGERAKQLNLVPRFLISTILPKSFLNMEKTLSEVFPVITPEMYYSMYSIKDAFRKKWMPNAMPVDDALALLLEYQRTKRMIPKIHFAFIEGENDSEEDVALLCHRVLRSGLRANFAIVRYNPFSDAYGKEPSEKNIRRNADVIKMHMPAADVKIITRVGPDVKASCGMFVEQS